MAFLCGYVWWAIGAFIIYKVLDRLIRKLYISDLNSRYILVTGCDTGFGNEIAKRLDRLGCNVFAGCLTETGETELRKQCSNKMKTISMNVASHDSVLKAFQFVKDSLPPGKGLHGIMNNAGIAGRRIGPVEWLTLDDYNDMFSVNLLGLVDVTVTFLPLVKKAKGRIVNTASVFGRHSLVGNAAYSISKYGVEAFSDSIRRQLRPFKVSIHLIEPGFHKTNMSNPDILGRALTAAWDQAPPDIQKEYGKEFLEKSSQVVIREFLEKIASDKISDVVDAYHHALLGTYPRARYVVGMDAKLFWLPVQWLPEWLGDWIMEKLNKDRPIPAACK